MEKAHELLHDALFNVKFYADQIRHSTKDDHEYYKLKINVWLSILETLLKNLNK